MRMWRHGLAACVLALAACGQQQSEQEAEGSAPPVETPEEVAKSKESRTAAYLRSTANWVR